MESISMLVIWYGRNSDMTPDYSQQYHGTFSGKNPDEVMTKYRQYQRNHDLSKYTRTEIAMIW